MHLDAGKESPSKVNAFIEIPKGGNIKYEYDEKLGILRVDRILHTSMVYPYNYGFVPDTKGEDGDALDIMVVSSAAFAPNTVVVARPIGALLMRDEEGVDTKIIAVPTEKVDPSFKGVDNINDLGEHPKNVIAHFFSYYKSIEPGKWAKVEGWVGVEKAHELIKEAADRAKKG